MSERLWDAIIVGGGPAGITAALRLARANLDVVVVEAAVYPGAENWSGAVYFAEQLADADVLGEAELEQAPYERRVVKRGFFSCNGPTLAGAEFRDPETFTHCYTVLRPVYDRYLAERARSLGVTLLTETTVDGLIRRGERVIGVHTDRGPLYGEVVFLAEGDASHLVSKEGFERDVVRAKRNGQPAFLQGVKEVIALDPALIEERFGVGPGEAACYELMLRNVALDGKAVRLNAAGLIYTNRSSISIGLVVPLENLKALSGDYNLLMEWYKGLPPIRRLIEGGESISYGAKIIRGGGLKELPRLVDEGVAIGGAATGIGVDFPYPNFTGPACATGRIFADAVIELKKSGASPTRERLEALYVKPLFASNYYKDVEHLRDWPAFIEHSDALFGRQIDLLNGSLYMMTRPQLGFVRKWNETIRLVAFTLRGKWGKTIGNLRQGSKALHVGRYAFKHAIPAILLSIPNTLLALLPFARGRGASRLDFSFWVDGEESGRLPWFKRWTAARYAPALSKAAGVLYANDGVPLKVKLDRCVGIVMRRLSLWELLGTIVGVVGFLLTVFFQWLAFKVRKPSLAQQSESFFGRWLMRWRSFTDLSAGAVPEAKSHDAKLGEISYTGEAGSHIKVFFPPEKPGALEDPSESALWRVCPAAVYQIVQDRTLHASVAVNFENCVKCESCWRIEPQHVDWSRFGEHRLVYEVYTEADGALKRIIAERELGAAPDIEPDFWNATLAGQLPGATLPEVPEELREALLHARRVVARARAKCTALHDDVWKGPRVLEPGQVAWYRGAIEYAAALAEEAAAAAVAEPIENWLSANEMNSVHVELLGARRDLEALTARVREHAGTRRFFAAEADTRQLRDHHLRGLRALLDWIGELCLIPTETGDPVAELRAMEVASPERVDARRALRDHLAAAFDRLAVRRLEQGGAPQAEETETLRAAARAALGNGASGGGFDAWEHLRREDIIAELAWVDPSLAAIVAAHLASVDALSRAGAPASVLDRFANVERFCGVALEADAERSEAGWNGQLPFVFSALAESYVARAGGHLGLFDGGKKGASLESTPAMGLTGAAVAELTLRKAKPKWEGPWSAADETALFGARAKDVAAIALGAGSLVTERAIDHALSRIQFPDMFQDIDGRDAVGKFGAVRAHVAHTEAARLAVETLLQDVLWTGDDDGLEARVAKVAVTDLFGPDMPSITYRTGQVAGGSAFSEEDVFSKVYRDSSIFPHYILENALLNIGIGEDLAASGHDSLLARISDDVHRALLAMAPRPILDFEVKRLREAEEQLTAAFRRALERGYGAPATQAVHDIAGELATRLYCWARLLVRAHRRLEAALPAQRYVEAAQLWADIVEERLVELDGELEMAPQRADLGKYAFQLGDYPDAPIATSGIDFDYERDIIDAARGHRSGDFLLKPFDLDETRFVPEQIWTDDVVRSRYEEYLRLFRERYLDGDWAPSFERYIEQRHYIPRSEIDWALAHGFFRAPIPKEYNGQGRSKADYYNLCTIARRLGDVAHTLTIQASYSIGTTPMLLGLDEVKRAERELQSAVDQADLVDGLAGSIEGILADMESPDFDALKNAYIAVDKDVRGAIGKSRILKKVVFGKFMSAWGKGGRAGMTGDLGGFAVGLKKAVAGLEGWRQRATAELEEMPRRRLAHEFYLRLISARMISAFALTEPSSGSDTARQRTEARLDSRRVHTDADGVKFFYLDESNEAGRRNIADMRRIEFDGEKIFYRYSDEAEPAEVLSLEYTYEEDEEKYRYYMVGGRRIDIHDMALIREVDGEERYEFYVLNGAKMWITNAHIAGVEAIYARTPGGVTGFMVDALTEGFLVGKDEEKMGQRASCTNEITLTNARIPRECMIGIEGRGQENALETLNVGRTGLCVSSSASVQQAIGDAADYLAVNPRGSEGWARYRLGLALEEMFAIESLAYDLIGIYDDKTSDMPRVESCIAKLYGTDGLHRNLHYLEPLYGIEGQTQRFRIEKDRRDARVMTIYEGTNEIQQFLLLKDSIDMIGPKLEKLEGLEPAADGSPFDDEVRIHAAMLAVMHERLKLTRSTYKSAAWQKALVQPIFFRLSNMVSLVKAVETVVRRAHWIARHLTADGDETRRAWCVSAARGFVARSNRQFSRLALGFDRDFETLKLGGRTAELKLAETVFDQAEAAQSAQAGEGTGARIARTPITRDLEIVVAMERAPRLAPRPRLEDGRVAEHVSAFTAGDRRALRLALGLKRAAPERVGVTLICAGPLAAEDGLRFGLAAGADRGILLDTGGAEYAEHAVASAIAATLDERGIEFDLLLSGASADSPSGGRLGLRLAGSTGVEWLPAATDVWVDGDAVIYSSDRFPGTVRTPTPAVGSVAAAEGEPAWAFSAAGFTKSLRRSLEVVAMPADAERSADVYAAAAAAVSAEEGEEAGSVEPERAAELLIELGDLGDGAGAPVGAPYAGDASRVAAEDLSWPGVVFIAELDGDDLARNARAPLEAAVAFAARTSQKISALVIDEPLEDRRRRRVAGQLMVSAPFERIAFAEHEALTGSAPRARNEALIRLLGPEVAVRPDYLVTTPWLADALPVLAAELRESGLPVDELSGVSRIEFDDGDATFVRPAHERKLRARRRQPVAGDGMHIVWCEPEVAVEAAELPRVKAEVVRIEFELEHDAETDALTQALIEAKQALGVVTLENAEFVIDVGAGLGSIDNMETVVEPLRKALLELGAPNVEIGATRKVTMDMSWLPDERQVGQTGVRVNPRVMIALGVSGAPQHIDYVADRAVIFAFNLDAQAPLMTLNQRREQPKVVPVVGDLMKTVPRFVAALRSRRQ